MSDRIFTIGDITRLVKPIAEKYKVQEIPVRLLRKRRS